MSLTAPSGTVAPPAPADPEAALGLDDGQMGDGTTVRSRTSERWRRMRGWVLIGAIVIAMATITTIMSRSASTGIPLDPESTDIEGSRAVAQVLGRNGVDVTRTDRAQVVLDNAGPGTTVVVVDAAALTDSLLDDVLHTGADVVLPAASPSVVGSVVDERLVLASPNTRIARRSAGCAVPQTNRAMRVTSGGAEYGIAEGRNGDGIEFCYGSKPGVGSYVVARKDGYDIRVLGLADALTNGYVTENDNAALALATLGRHPTLIWLMADVDDPLQSSYGDADQRAGSLELAPDWVVPAFFLLLASLVPLAWWKGRRLGRLVREPLPVVVRSAETAEGRASLYRRVGAYDRALQVLQAAAMHRAATRLGLPSSATATQVHAAWAQAVGLAETDVTQVFSPAPGINPQGLVQRVAAIDRLEEQLTGSGVLRHPTGAHPTTVQRDPHPHQEASS